MMQSVQAPAKTSNCFFRRLRFQKDSPITYALWLIAAAGLALAITLTWSNPTRDLSHAGKIDLRAGLLPGQRVTANFAETNLDQAFVMYSELTGRIRLPRTNHLAQSTDTLLGGRLTRWHWIQSAHPSSGIQYHADGLNTSLEIKEHLEQFFRSNNLVLVPEGAKYFRAVPLTKN